MNIQMDKAKGWTPDGYILPRYQRWEMPHGHGDEIEQLGIVIVGGGLAGLTLAALLGLRGIKVTLLDDDDTIGVKGASSRGMVWTQKSLEIFDKIGVAKRMQEKGVVWSVGRTLSGNETVFTFDRSGETPSLQPAFVNLQQFYVEWYLVDRIEELDTVEIRWGNAVTDLVPDGDGATLTVAAPNDEYRVAADWVIDATGADSPLREPMGRTVDVAEHVDNWCICDVHCTDMNVPERWTWVEAPFNEGRAVWQHMMGDNVWRLDYQLSPDCSFEEASDREVAMERVQAHLGLDKSFSVVWQGPWQYRTQLLDRFRGKHLFSVGDAAHVKSPFGARGGNSGIQDVENLAWKLELMLSGLADERLLESYNTERRAAAVENIAVTSNSARFLAPQSPFEKRLRDALLDLASRHPFAQAMVNTGRLSVPNEYDTSAVIGSGGGYCIGNLPVTGPDGSQKGLNDLFETVETGVLGLYLPKAGKDSNRGAISGIGGEGLPYVVRTLEAGQGADKCTLNDKSGAIVRMTEADPGDLIVLRPDLYVAEVLKTPNAAEVERALERATAFKGRK